MTEVMGIVTTGQWGPCEARLQVKAERQTVQWIDGPDKTGSMGVGDEDPGVKPSEHEPVGRSGAPQREVQELELQLEQQPALQERKQETQEVTLDPEEGAKYVRPDLAEETREALSDREDEAQEAQLDPEETQETLSDPEEETLEVPSDPEEETLEAPSDPEEEALEAPSDPDERTQEVPLDPEETQKAPPNSKEETREAPSDPGMEINDEAGLAEGPTDLEGSVVPARRKLTISGNLPPNNVIAYVESAGARRRGRTRPAPQGSLPTNEGGDEESMSICDG